MKNRTLQKNSYTRLKVIAATSPNQTYKINMILGVGIVATLVVLALLINHINTASFRFADLSRDSSRLVERNSGLEARISESQTLGSIEERAVELGMVVVDEYKFLVTVDTAVAKR